MNHRLAILACDAMLGEIIVDLLCLGVRCNSSGDRRNGGAGPAEGMSIIIEGHPVMVPVAAHYVKHSPYRLQHQGGKQYLLKNDKKLYTVDFVSKPDFYNHKTKCGISFNKIALLHGKECLASTVYQRCSFWNTKYRCKFCGIELSLKNNATIEKKSPDQLAQVAKAALSSSHIKHIVLTTGANGQSSRHIEYLAECASAIKKTKLNIHTQFCPPDDVDTMWLLKEAGVDTVGIHIESFDMDILSTIAPAKAMRGLAKYTAAWKKAVEIFGLNQVSSFLLCGIGERAETLLEAGKYLSEIGVYPFLVPFRPIPKTAMENYSPPAPSKMINIYEKLGPIIKSNNLNSQSSLAGCVRCGACSAIKFFEN
jgi:radical SAM protein (TIGR04043 family)